MDQSLPASQADTGQDLVLSVSYHDDVGRIGDTLSLSAVLEGQALMLGSLEHDFGGSPLGRDSCMGREQFELLPWEPHGSIAIRAVHGTVATHVNGELITGTRILCHGDRISAGRTVLVLHTRPKVVDTDTQENTALSGVSAAVCGLRQHIADLAATDVPVLITGESGVGKEVVARELHRLSGRKGMMVSLNGRALPGSLAEGHLLGWKAGAFDGATADRESLFEKAAGGSLFLDSLSEMSPGLQATLLKVLRSGTYTPLGSDEVKPVNVRIIAATTGGEPRVWAELYDLMSEHQLTIPPLRERPEDIPLLAYHLLHQCARGLSMKPPIIGFGLMQSLLNAQWPLNARALRTALKSLLVVQPNQARLAVHPVLKEALGAALTTIRTTQEVTLPPSAMPARFITDPELRQVAEAVDYDSDEVARRLGCTRSAISRRLKRIRLERKHWKSS